MSKTKKALGIAAKVLTWALVVFTVAAVAFSIISINTVGKQNASIFGCKLYVVLSDSMSDTFQAGDIVVSKVRDDYTDLQEGDIITFTSSSAESYGETITHKIRRKTVRNGQVEYITYGTTTGVDDSAAVSVDRIHGVYAFRLPKLGYFFNFMRTPLGYVVVIGVPFLIIIALNGVQLFKLFRQYKTEKQAVAAEEKQEVERMKRELEELKAKMSQDGGEDKKQ